MGSFPGVPPDPRILLVDESSHELANLRQLLASLALSTIDEARTGAAALRKLKEAQYDLIFSTQNLPDVRGTDVLQIVRQSPKLARTPFIIITGIADKGEFLNAIELGVTDYIVRPFTLETLEGRVRRALEQKRGVFVEWSERYSVGDAAIDAQHMRLIRLINDLHDSISLGRGREMAGWVLDELVHYTKSHFTEEEQLLGRCQYPALTGHEAHHQRLTQQVLDLQAKFASVEKAGLTVEIIQFMQRWLTDHILGADKKYAPFLKERGPAGGN